MISTAEQCLLPGRRCQQAHWLPIIPHCRVQVSHDIYLFAINCCCTSNFVYLQSAFNQKHRYRASSSTSQIIPTHLFWHIFDTVSVDLIGAIIWSIGAISAPESSPSIFYLLCTKSIKNIIKKRKRYFNSSYQNYEKQTIPRANLLCRFQ